MSYGVFLAFQVAPFAVVIAIATIWTALKLRRRALLWFLLPLAVGEIYVFLAGSARRSGATDAAINGISSNYLLAAALLLIALGFKLGLRKLHVISLIAANAFFVLLALMHGVVTDM